MKLLKLEIHNIASIEDAVIDFANGPLAEESRFLIAGPTGSGKSTLLDAICLALFNMTPRLAIQNSERFSFENNNNPQEISITDTRNLMRNGSTECWSNVTFIDNNGETLIAKWYCQRAHKKIDGKIQDSKRSIETENGTMLSTRSSEINKIIAERIGLTFDQFCRTSMLAQGEFTKFLKANEKEKAEILEKLTGTNIYSEISSKIYEITKEKESKVKELEAKTSGITLLTEEELKQIGETIAKLNTETAALGKREITLTKQLQWLNELKDANYNKEQCDSEWNKHQEFLNSEEYKSLLNIIRDWDATEDVRTKFALQSQLQQEIVALDTENENLRTKYQTLANQVLGFRNYVASVEQEKQKTEQFIAENESKSEIYNRIELIKNLFSQIITSRREIETLNNECANLASSIKNNLTKAESIKSELNAEEEKEKAKASEIKQREEETNRFNQDEITALQKSLTQELNELLSLKTNCEKYIKAKDDLSKKNDQIIHKQNEITNLGIVCNDLDSQIRELDEAKKRARDSYERIKSSGENYLKDLRSTLSKGDMCPLCGQTIIELTSDETFLAIISPLKKNIEEIESKLETANKLSSNKKAAKDEAKKTLNTYQKEYSEIELHIKEYEELLNAATIWEQYKDKVDPANAINQDIESKQKLQSETNEQSEKLNSILKSINTLQEEKNKIEKTIASQKEELNSIEKSIVTSQTSIKGKNNSITDCKNSISNIETQLSEIFTHDNWRVEWNNAPKEFEENLEKEAKDFTSANDKRNQLITQYTLEANNLAELDGTMCNITQSRPSWADYAPTAERYNAGLKENCNNLKTMVDNNTTNTKDKQQHLDDLTTAIDKYIKEHPEITIERINSLIQRANEINEFRTKKEKISDETTRIQAQMDQIKDDIEKLAQNRPEMSEDATIESVSNLIEDVKTQKENANIQKGAENNKIEQDKKNKTQFESIQKEIDKAKKEHNSWAKLSELFGSAEGKKFRAIAQSYIMNNMLRNANTYLRQFMSRYELLSKNNSLTILIRDIEARGIERPISNVSGGESFLLSLSLALGLSSLSNNAMSMDTLFIDEGFGTLDSDYLNTVIDALERLHQMGGKKVGIISHVESLKERITTQIQVSRIDSTRSKVKVVSTL